MSKNEYSRTFSPSQLFRGAAATSVAALVMAFLAAGLHLQRAEAGPLVVLDPSEVPPPITRTTPTTVQLTLTVEEVVAELTDSSTYEFWTFGGTVPGPMLRVMEGDTVELTLVNPASSLRAHNIDLHAVNGPGGGAPDTTVFPGESKTFTFQALNVGGFIYHCAFPPAWRHIAQGMYGGIVVEPVGGLPPVDREFYVVQGDWYATPPDASGHSTFDLAKALAEEPTYFTFNGHTDALTQIHPLQARQGETVRIFFGVGGPNIGANFHIIGEIFDKVYSGSPDTYVLNEETWYVPPGSVSIVELTLNKPGDYLLVDHALTRIEKGALGILHVDAVPEPSASLLTVLAITGLLVGTKRSRRHRRQNAHHLCEFAQVGRTCEVLRNR